MTSVATVLLILCGACVTSQDIEWFKQTPSHNDNLQQIINGWDLCPEWEQLSQETEVPLYAFGSTTNTVTLPAKNNTKFNFTARCITLQVPLNWDIIQNSTKTIDYYITHIYSGFDPNNTNGNGALWMLQGGPGGSGKSLYPLAIPWMNFLDDTFDVYLPDHRGTGSSAALQSCPNETVSACIQYLHDTYGEDLKQFTTYAASMDLGYAVDLFQNMATYNESNSAIYGVSYGTYYLNQYLQLFPDQLNASVFDGVVAPDIEPFPNFDRDANEVGLLFLERCQQNEFCGNQFAELGDHILNATADLFDEFEGDSLINSTNTSLCVRESQLGLQLLLKSLFAGWLQNVDNRVMIPPVLYRLIRCNDEDYAALNHLWQSIFSALTDVSVNGTNITEMMNMNLYFNIALSELWHDMNASYDAPSGGQLANASNGYFFATGAPLMLSSWYDSWDKYTPKSNVYHQYADPAKPMLFIHGDLDPQTHIKHALHAAKRFGANIDNNTITQDRRYFVTFPNTPHAVILTSLIRNYTDVTLSVDHDFETCGMYVIKAFLDPDNDYIPDTQCLQWMDDIDFEGVSNISKQISSSLFGTSDIWGLTSVTTEPPVVNVTTTTEYESGQPTKGPTEYPTKSPTSPMSKEEEAWFIVGIVFIVLFGIAVIVIFYLSFLICVKKKDEDMDSNGRRKGPYTAAPRSEIEAGALTTSVGDYSD